MKPKLHTQYPRLRKLLLIAMLLGTGLSASFAQWKELGPLHAPITALTYDGSTYLYAASQYGIYRSADNGDSWTLWKKQKNGEINVGAFPAAGRHAFGLINGEIYTFAYDWDPFFAFSNDPPYLASTDPGIGYYPLCLEDYEDCTGVIYMILSVLATDS